MYQVSTDPSFSTITYSGATSPSAGQAGSTGVTAATSPGTVSDDASVGTVAWSNPMNATGSDTNYATVGLSSTYSHYLEATNFGFAIPTGATINGILAEIKRFSTYNATKDNSVKIVKSNGSIGTINKANTAYW